MTQSLIKTIKFIYRTFDLLYPVIVEDFLVFSC